MRSVPCMGSDMPVPRRSMTMTRQKRPSPSSRKRASAGSSKNVSMWEISPGRKSRSIDPVPVAAHATVTVPLRA